MIYDYAIIGAGISGTVCAYELNKKNYKCILFEKTDGFQEKICGGGISYKALRKLNDIGIDINSLFKIESKKIYGHYINIENKSILKLYKKNKISLGMQRVNFDNFLRNLIVNQNIPIEFEQKISKVSKIDNVFCINGIYSKNIIWAIGAKNIDGIYLKGQSIGYSGQIHANVSLPSNLFYYWYYDNNDKTKYFWAFPIGENLWNIGIWSRYPFTAIRQEYNICLEKFILNKLKGKWEYFRRPKAEFLGHIDQRIKQSIFSNGIGDFSGNCNQLNGGGIIGAIESAINFAEKIK